MKSSVSIEFLLGFEPRSLKNGSPTMTVLQYLRNVERMTGTKEGCAEGDCGACTVVLGECRNEKMSYKAVNSCILFVPFLHGKQLITVEHLKQSDGALHPVQQSLVDEHGSQCGFCTPGFVMSMFSMVHNRSDPSKTAIDDALAGNLCRCTGYVPIVRAVRKTLAAFEQDEFDRAENSTLALLSRMHSQTIYWQNKDQKYMAPRTTTELSEILEQNPQNSIVAGATDVGLWVTKQGRQLETVVYVGSIDSMKEIKRVNGTLQIGAAVSVSDAHRVLAEHYSSLDELFRRYGSVQIRNLATIGGNVANGSPIGDSLPALVALNANLILNSALGSRTLPIEDFFLEYGKQDITSTEYLARIDVPLPSPNQIFRIYKLSKRYHQDISAVCGAFSIIFKESVVQEVRICYGGMAGTPLRAHHCESALLGNRFSIQNLESAKSALKQDFSPITDFRASAEYRSLVAQNLLDRFANDVLTTNNVTVWS